MSSSDHLMCKLYSFGWYNIPDTAWNHNADAVFTYLKILWRDWEVRIFHIFFHANDILPKTINKIPDNLDLRKSHYNLHYE